jgi:hypothetical protein
MANETNRKSIVCNGCKNTIDENFAVDVFISTDNDSIDMKFERHDEKNKPTTSVCVDCLCKFLKSQGHSDAEIRAVERAYRPQMVIGEHKIVNNNRKAN